MSFETDPKRNVQNFYGPRTAYEGVVGEFPTTGTQKEAGIEFSATTYTTTSGKLPKGAKILAAYVEIEEAFVLGGTTPTILVGTDGSEVTNGFAISEAQAEGLGLYAITTFVGTWANQLAADTTVGVALGGTNPTITTVGKARISIKYVLQ